MSIKVMRIWTLTLSALLLALAIGSCGKVADEGSVFDSNTNWLMRCGGDNQCDGSLRCYCGICTKPCGQDDECGRLQGAQCEESGEVLCGAQASAGGLCVLGCTGNSECGAGFDCTQGQCVPVPCENVAILNWDDVFQTVNFDLAMQDPDDARYQRYLVIGNDTSAADDGGCGLRIELQRQALSKVINSLSINAALQAPIAIDAAERIYRIDQRDYDWERPMYVDGEFYADGWDALGSNDTYAVPFIGDDANDAAGDTGTITPVRLADAFIAAATEPSVYYALLGIARPDSSPVLESELDDFLLNELGIDPLIPPDVEAGFTEGGIEFLARQWPIEVRAGYLWMISDVGRELGSLASFPLAAPLGDHELIFTLPNGLHAFAFMNAGGRLSEGWNATVDARERDGLTRAPRSNLRRHTPRLGIHDEVRDIVDRNAASFSSGELELTEQRFPGPEVLTLLLQQEFASFAARSLRQLDLNPDAPDPILQSYELFDRDVTLEVAAAELMLAPDDVRDNLDLLAPALAPLALDGGSVPRSVFTSLYRNSLCILSVVLENQPDATLCP